MEQLEKDFPETFLTMRVDEAERTQMKTYAWCVEEQRTHFNWIAFFDIDEFLVIRDDACAPASPPSPALLAAAL